MIVALAWAYEPAPAEAAHKPACHSVRATVKHVSATRHQRQMIHRVLTVGRNQHMPNKVMRAALAAATQESGLNNLRSGDGSSAGLFQLISGWGPLSKRTNPEWAARWFFRNALTHYRRRPGIRIGALAQKVEASANPGGYDLWVAESTRTYARWLKGCAA